MCCLVLQVIAEGLSEEEIRSLKTMFESMDTDKSGSITYEELKTGLNRLGSKLPEAEVIQLMEAVSTHKPSLLLISYGKNLKHIMMYIYILSG